MTGATPARRPDRSEPYPACCVYPASGGRFAGSSLDVITTPPSSCRRWFTRKHRQQTTSGAFTSERAPSRAPHPQQNGSRIDHNSIAQVCPDRSKSATSCRSSRSFGVHRMMIAIATALPGEAHATPWYRVPRPCRERRWPARRPAPRLPLGSGERRILRGGSSARPGARIGLPSWRWAAHPCELW